MLKILQYENWWGYKKRAYWIEKHIKDGDSCIEVGCGTGSYLTLPVAQLLQENHKDAHIYGLDISDKSIARAKENAKLLEFDESMFICADIVNNPLPQKYDVVICSETLEHLESEYLKVFTVSLSNIVMRGGILIITVPNGNGSYEKGQRFKKSWTGRKLLPFLAKITGLIGGIFFKKYWYFEKLDGTDSILNVVSESDSEHIQFFRKEDIENLFISKGFQLIEFTGISKYNGAFSTLLPTFQKLTLWNDALGDRHPEKASSFGFVFKKC